MNLHWKRCKTFQFADDIILCIENPKESHSPHRNYQTQYRGSTGLQNTRSYTKSRYISIHSQDLYNKNYKTLLGEIKDSLDKWKGISHLWIGRLTIVLRWQYSPNRTPSKFKLFFPPRNQQTDPRIVRIERVLGQPKQCEERTSTYTSQLQNPLQSQNNQDIIWCYSHAFQETNSLRRTIQIVECSLLHRRAQGRVSSWRRTQTSFCENLVYPKVYVPKPTSPNSLKLV